MTVAAPAKAERLRFRSTARRWPKAASQRRSRTSSRPTKAPMSAWTRTRPSPRTTWPESKAASPERSTRLRSRPVQSNHETHDVQTSSAHVDRRVCRARFHNQTDEYVEALTLELKK